LGRAFGICLAACPGLIDSVGTPFEGQYHFDFGAVIMGSSQEGGFVPG